MLQMKKTMALVLTLAVVAGCATNAPQVNQVSTTSNKVEAVKVTPAIDLGNKDGGSFSLNLKFAKNSPFGIKATTLNGFASNAGAIATTGVAGSFIILKLHSFAFGAPAALSAARFDAPSAGIIDGFGTAPVFFKDFKTATSTTLKFNGLNLNKSYTISARAYVPAVPSSANVDPADMQIDIPGTGIVAKNTGTYVDFKPFGFRVGDIIKASTFRYTVTAVNGVTGVPTVIDFATGVAPSGGAILTNVPFTYFRNVVSSTGLPGGLGGGTQGALGSEETISVTSAGVTSVSGDTNANATLDMNIQLMQDLGAYSTGTLTVTEGSALSGGESVTSP